MSTNVSSSSTRNIALGAGIAAAAGVAAYFGVRRARASRAAKKEVKAEAKEEVKVPSKGVVPEAQSARNARIVALASAFPPNEYSQSQFKAAFLRNHPHINAEEKDFVDRVWTGTMIDTCRSYLKEEDLFKKMTREHYVKYVKEGLRDMAVRATRDAIAQWGGDAKTITHIVFGTMTGTIHAPTMDSEIAIAVGLQTNIKRLNVEGMGCLTGYRCLGLASDIARADASNIVLVVVCDLRNALGNQLSTHVAGTKLDKSNVIVSSLFRDSGAACIVSSAALGTVPATTDHKPLYEIVEHRSMLVPGSFDLVKYHEKDDAVIYLYIAKELPDKIAEVLPTQVEALLRPYGLNIDDCTYSVHTGGPKVLKNVQSCLKVSSDRLTSSWYCMKKFGNLSGSSNLVVLDHQRKMAGDTRSKEFVVCMSFGPGVGMELILLRAVAAPHTPISA